MSTFNYSGMAAKAREQVTKFGRAITLVKFDIGTEENKPWRADSTPVETKLPTTGVFIPGGSGGKMVSEDLAKRSTEYVMIARTDDISGYNAVDDGDRRYTVTGMEKIAPGDSIVVWMVGLKQ